MDSLWSELIQLIYSHLYIHKDSLRFSLVSKSIRAALPEEISILHKHHHTMMASLNEITAIRYDIYNATIGFEKAYMSLRKCHDRVTIQQQFWVTYEMTLDIYTYIGHEYINRYQIFNTNTQCVCTKVLVGINKPICYAHTGLDIGSHDVIDSWLGNPGIEERSVDIKYRSL